MKYLATLATVFTMPPVFAGEVSLAVASNFTVPMRQIAVDFEHETGHKALLSFGATGRFYAQIKNGAPFDGLLAADQETPAILEKEGTGVANSRFTYAIGKLVLWSSTPGYVDNAGMVLKTGQFQHIALANPKLAPYGAAAVEVLTTIHPLDALRPRWVQAENIAQAYQFVASGNAELGFVALSQILGNSQAAAGSAWLVPADLYQPIRQDAVMLDKGKDKPAAEALMKYLRSDRVRATIRSLGYDLPPS